VGRRILVVVTVSVLLTGCAVSERPGDASTSVATTMSVRPPVTCASDGCDVALVRFDHPLDLGDVISVGESVGAAAVALWRTDAVCVPAVQARPSPPTQDTEPSQFAYVDADIIRDVQNAGPPATTGGWAEALRDRFVIEWTAARAPGVLFEGAAFLLPATDTVIPGAIDQTPVPAYLTDETGVLYLENHFRAFESVFATPSGACRAPA
jgi:hypothetical protein